MAARGVKVWGILALVLVGSCTTPHRAPPPPPKPAGPAPLSIGPTAPISVAPPPKDACGANQLQYLVGKPRTDIPIPLQPNLRRVSCSTCPVTQDFVPFRQSIIYDAQSGIITSVKCG